MIFPLCKSALNAGANSSWLNPQNSSQDRISIYLGKPIRAIARMIYGLGCLILISPIGLFYHTGQAIRNSLLSGQHIKAYNHLKAGSRDGYVFTMTTILLMGARSEFSLAKSLTTIERTKSIYLFAMSLDLFGNC